MMRVELIENITRVIDACKPKLHINTLLLQLLVN